MGSLFVSSLAAYPSARTGSSSNALHNKGAETNRGISDNEVFPLDEMEQDEDGDTPSPLCPPSVSVVIAFFGALKLSMDSTEDEIGEKLESLMVSLHLCLRNTALGAVDA